MASDILSENSAALVTANSTENTIRAAEDLVRQELERVQQDICVTNNFQAEDMVVLHMVMQVVPHVPVVFLDTGYHFAEVYAYRDRMAREWSMNLINLVPEQTVAEQESLFGILNQTILLRALTDGEKPTVIMDSTIISNRAIRTITIHF